MNLIRLHLLLVVIIAAFNSCKKSDATVIDNQSKLGIKQSPTKLSTFAKSLQGLSEEQKLAAIHSELSKKHSLSATAITETDPLDDEENFENFAAEEWPPVDGAAYFGEQSDTYDDVLFDNTTNGVITGDTYFYSWIVLEQVNGYYRLYGQIQVIIDKSAGFPRFKAYKTFHPYLEGAIPNLMTWETTTQIVDMNSSDLTHRIIGNMTYNWSPDRRTVKHVDNRQNATPADVMSHAH